MRVLTVSLVVLAFTAGCATQSSSLSKAKSSYERFEVDAEYVALVNKATRDRGVSVHWVNPPKVRVEKSKDKGE